MEGVPFFLLLVVVALVCVGIRFIYQVFSSAEIGKTKGSSGTGMKQCSSCKEYIVIDATKCKFCGTSTDSEFYKLMMGRSEDRIRQLLVNVIGAGIILACIIWILWIIL
jgi:hypothetical protein|uniref:Uncharacterized protein n=1 Tax=uncultured gamma proteobacterium HF4000_47G05 TaxID=723582 RepID=E7C8M1_9GAMM|nr:hypothetical protein [uncultured gamma proteobacterium HF4000_47G05]